jgi:polyhydroxybutyrate depolymerase
MPKRKIAVLFAILALAGAGARCLAFDTKIGLGGKDVRKNLTWITADTRKPLGAGEYGRKLQFRSEERFYEIHLPANYDPNRAYPVVLVLHGGGGYPAGAAYQTGMDAVADREGFVVAYPAGYSTALFKDRLLVWNDGRRFDDGSEVKDDSVGFISAVLDDLSALIKLDANRVYCTGMSNGAHMCYRLARQLSHRIAAIAAVTGHERVDGPLPPPPRKISVMQVSGRKDEYAPYKGGMPSGGKGLLKNKFQAEMDPVEDVVESWAKFNKCDMNSKTVRRIGSAEETRYTACADGTEVVLWTLDDGGHTWPGGERVPAEVRLGVGEVNHDISASEEIWKFFQRHRLQ